LHYETDRVLPVEVVDQSSWFEVASSMSIPHSKPRLACEIAADRVIAGRVADNGASVEAFASRELSPGSVVPDLIESNLKQRDAVSDSIRETLAGVGGRAHDVIAVLPDASVRVVLLDFETLPPKREEAEGVVRFRLKKSLPFDVDKAKISYHAQFSTGGLKVVAAVALNSVVEEYESVFRDAGYSPGIVMPSMLAAIGAADANKPTLVVKVDARTTSIAILDKQQLLLFRTLENTRGVSISGEQLAEEVYPSVVFFQDTYNLNIAQIFVAGLSESLGAGPALKAQSGAEVTDLIHASHVGNGAGTVPRWRMSGVVGALIS
jgi:type IV pilus assembly protein PilM